MTEEIKKIINWLNQIIKENKESDVSLNSCVVPFETLYKLQDYITNLQKENEKLKSNQEKTIEYIKKDTRWFDSEYAKIYGTLCNCKGAKGDRLEVLVNPTNLLNILQGGDE